MPPPPGPQEPNWGAPIADGLSSNGDRQMVNVGAERGVFRRIRVEAVEGNPHIVQIAIKYPGVDATQIVPVNETWSRGQGRVIDLDGRAREVEGVIVYTTPSRGSYSVFAK
ncbi:MAG: hypothetical protein M3680_00315 [Myxococcota bacterium]|nr:hypothetical protein [Myxococcota bacterium]